MVTDKKIQEIETHIQEQNELLRTLFQVIDNNERFHKCIRNIFLAWFSIISIGFIGVCLSVFNNIN